MKKWIITILWSGALAITLGILAMKVVPLFAAEQQVDDLSLIGGETSATINAPFEITIKDNNPADTKVVIPIDSNLQFKKKVSGDATVTKDETNNQLVIDWLGDKKETTLQISFTKEGKFPLKAYTVRENQTVASKPVEINVLAEKKVEEKAKKQEASAPAPSQWQSRSMQGRSIKNPGTPFNRSPYGTIVNNSGNYVSGKKIVAKKIETLTYHGSNIVKDASLNGSSLNTSQFTLGSGSSLEIKNMGFYEGESCSAVLRAQSKMTVTLSNSGITLLSFSSANGEISFNLWEKDSKGTVIRDSTQDFTLPIEFSAGNPVLQAQFSPSFVLDNIVAFSDADGVSLDQASPSANYKMEMYRPTSSNPLQLGLVLQATNNFNYTNQTIDWGSGDPVTYPSSITLFQNKSVQSSLVPYPPPTINNNISHIDKDSTVFRFSASQVLPLEPDNNYPNLLHVYFQLGDWVKAGDTPQIEVLDSQNKPVSNVWPIRMDSTGKVGVQIPKATLQNLKSNKVTMNIQVQIDPNQALVNTLDSEGTFAYLPYEVWNNQQSSSKLQATAKVPIPAPLATMSTPTLYLSKRTGKASTDDLDLSTLVAETYSIFPNDQVVAVGLDKETVFTKPGIFGVQVKVKSLLTNRSFYVPMGIYVKPPIIHLDPNRLEFVSTPSVIDFGDVPISSSAVQEVPVQKVDEELAVQDTRPYGNHWTLKVQESQTMTSVSASSQGYRNMLYYRVVGQLKPITKDSMIIATGQSSQNKQSISDSWGSSSGLLLKANGGLIKNGSYSGVLTWNLENAP